VASPAVAVSTGCVLTNVAVSGILATWYNTTTIGIDLDVVECLIAVAVFTGPDIIFCRSITRSTGLVTPDTPILPAAILVILYTGMVMGVMVVVYHNSTCGIGSFLMTESTSTLYNITFCYTLFRWCCCCIAVSIICTGIA
jgi:hypothetical protein